MPVGDRFVELPAEAMLTFLESKGFALTTKPRSRREIVYERAHHVDPRYIVLVYTSVATGNARARKRGADAIRVVAIFDDGKRSYGIAKTPRVFRTGSVEAVLERTHERMRECYAVCNRAIGFYKELSDRSDNKEGRT